MSHAVLTACVPAAQTKDRVFSDPDMKIHVTLDEVDPAQGYAVVNLIVGTNNCFGHGTFSNGRCTCDRYGTHGCQLSCRQR
jgi:hypothetical protein